MIRSATARRLMYAWHGGQSSPLYAAASSGIVESWGDLKGEVRCCYCDADNRHDKADLSRLMDWLIYQQGKKTDRLPWAEKGES